MRPTLWSVVIETGNGCPSSAGRRQACNNSGPCPLCARDLDMHMRYLKRRRQFLDRSWAVNTRQDDIVVFGEETRHPWLPFAPFAFWPASLLDQGYSVHSPGCCRSLANQLGPALSARGVDWMLSGPVDKKTALKTVGKQSRPGGPPCRTGIIASHHHHQRTVVPLFPTLTLKKIISSRSSGRAGGGMCFTPCEGQARRSRAEEGFGLSGFYDKGRNFGSSGSSTDWSRRTKVDALAQGSTKSNYTDKSIHVHFLDPLTAVYIIQYPLSEAPLIEPYPPEKPPHSGALDFSGNIGSGWAPNPACKG